MRKKSLVGMEGVKKNVFTIVSNADAYGKGGVKPPHFFMNVVSGNGQTTVARYVSEMFYDNNVIPNRALDEFLEYRPEGSVSSVRKMIDEIEGNAVYTNSYEGIIVVDISGVAPYWNEAPADILVKAMEVISKSATVIIFCTEDSKCERLKARLQPVMGKYIDVNIFPYTIHDYASIILQNIIDRGIRVDDPGEMEKAIFDILSRRSDICTVKQALTVVEDLVLLADFNGRVPVIHSDRVKSECSLDVKESEDADSIKESLEVRV